MSIQICIQKNTVQTLAISMLLFGAGCASDSKQFDSTLDEPDVSIQEDNFSCADRAEFRDSSPYAFPVPGFAERATRKGFGEYIVDRFRGYHAGVDVEFGDVNEEVPVRAIANGTVERVERVGGYGGLVVIEHELNGEKLRVLYGHLDLGSVTLKPGDSVRCFEQIGVLGEGESEETDGERKHLHFAITSSDSIAGYVSRSSTLAAWKNPFDYYDPNETSTTMRTVDPDRELGGKELRLAFDLPPGTELEFVPSLKAWNVYTVRGEGSVRERSQFFIRYFDASDFLTLKTANILRTEDLMVGRGSYAARRYEIEKKPETADFPDQPSWRNTRHLVTDFRDKEGRTRYYVVAAAPDQSLRAIELFLSGMEIVSRP